MPEFDADERALILMSLRHFQWQAKQQVDHALSNNVTAAAWYATTFCIAKIAKLIEKMEKANARTS